MGSYFEVQSRQLDRVEKEAIPDCLDLPHTERNLPIHVRIVDIHGNVFTLNVLRYSNFGYVHFIKTKNPSFAKTGLSILKNGNQVSSR